MFEIKSPTMKPSKYQKSHIESCRYVRNTVSCTTMLQPICIPFECIQTVSYSSSILIQLKPLGVFSYFCHEFGYQQFLRNIQIAMCYPDFTFWAFVDKQRNKNHFLPMCQYFSPLSSVAMQYISSMNFTLTNRCKMFLNQQKNIIVLNFQRTHIFFPVMI